MQVIFSMQSLHEKNHEIENAARQQEGRIREYQQYAVAMKGKHDKLKVAANHELRE